MRKLTKEQELIELGKIWMKKSFDKGSHDQKHAQTVEENCIGIWEEMKQTDPASANQVDIGLIRLVAWWHDCYKSQLKSQTISSVLYEGRFSEQIFRQQAQPYLRPDRLEQVAFAIANHNKVWKFFFRLKKTPVLLRILLEADGVESIRSSRNRNGSQITTENKDIEDQQNIIEQKSLNTTNNNKSVRASIHKKKKPLVYKVFSWVLRRGLIAFFFFYPFSKYGRMLYFKNLK